MIRKHRRTFVTAAVVLLTTAGVLAAPASSGAVNDGSRRLPCEANSANTFSLDAKSGYVSTPDGNSIFMWSFAPSTRGFQLPGPTLCVDAGVQVTVVLHNSLAEPTSIVFPGQQHVRADGRPAQPRFDGTGLLTSMTDPAAPGGSVTYTFTAGTPGTYLYESGTDVALQREMGLYGAVVVRPPGVPDHVNGRGDSVFDLNREYVYVLSEVDPDLHLAVERRRPYDVTKTRARYFFINGRSMPDTIAPDNAAWLPSQPYGALVHIRPFVPGDPNSRPALVRYLDAGSVNYPFHPHGNDQRVVNQDGQPAEGAGGSDASYDKFLVDVGPGQSVDVLDQWVDAEHWDPASNPIPVPLPQLQDQIVGPGTETWFSENPYLGGTPGELPAGVVQNNQCGEYYMVAHSHALEQATNFGASFGGMMTLVRIDPPAGCPGS
ncbi:multicopper oxidase domain-containing protein [Amycolatopsis sp. CA-126428]|uniref:multicopper oxidase domain-containing protein n=1 Tax=Amycolatopsis sp. CA-126428 TaxID=2073158 RepID=UPI000CD31350|nr:multicopper oxidase domain-containing protein [Amycolatopsis sp. CA-126428]